MRVELDKLSSDTERFEFVDLYHTAPHELTEAQEERLAYFLGIIDFSQYGFESQREKQEHIKT